jgi:nifR3 family TIM-barrel protein
MRIGRYELSAPVLVAPMAGVTDAPFRQLAAELGAGLLCGEMVSSTALVHGNAQSLRMLDFSRDRHPVAAQLMGGDPAIMAAAAPMCVEAGADIVDLNMGCPVPKVVKTSGGAALLRDVRQAAAVAAAVVGAVSVPVTVKIRLGWDEPGRNYREVARALEDVGVAALAVHGRTRAQHYDPWADWEAIKAVKAAVRIPVSGSGDVRTGGDAERRRRESGCDGIMLARGTLGNLWLVRQVVERLATGVVVPDQTWSERLALVRRHCDLVLEYYGEERGVRLLRKFVAWGLKGCVGAARLRNLVQGLDSLEALERLFAEAYALDPEEAGAASSDASEPAEGELVEACAG